MSEEALSKTVESAETPIPRLGSLVVLGKNREIPPRKMHTEGRIIYSDATRMNARAAGVFLTRHIETYGYCPMVIFSTGPTSGEAYASEADALLYVLLRDFPLLRPYREQFHCERVSHDTPSNAEEVMKQFGGRIAELQPLGLITTSYHVDRAWGDFNAAGLTTIKLEAEKLAALDPTFSKDVTVFGTQVQGLIEETYQAVRRIPGAQAAVRLWARRSRK